MDTFEREYELSLYGKIAELSHSKKSTVLLVQNSLTGKIYIKKELKNYNIDVYQDLKQIQTLHLPTIYDIFEQPTTLVIIEEFINGHTLEDLLTEGKVIEERKAITYGIKLCEVLELLHNQTPPIIHRDLKPSNVMITNDGILKLIDFDVSRRYRQESELDTHILGTKGYAAPEQFGFEQTDGRSDIYSLGVLLNVLTTGKNPKVEKNSSSLGGIIERCTKFSPASRYQHVSELKAELSKLLNPIVEETHDSQKSQKIQMLLKTLQAIQKIKYECSPILEVEELSGNGQNINVLTVSQKLTERLEEAYFKIKASHEKKINASPQMTSYQVTKLKSELSKHLNISQSAISIEIKTKNQPQSQLEQRIAKIRKITRVTNILTYGFLYQLFTRKPFEPQPSKLTLIREVRQVPGYRSLNLVYLPIATYWYTIIFWGPFMRIETLNPILIIEDFLFAGYLLFITLFNGNYKNLQFTLPIVKRNRGFGLVLYNLVLFMMVGILFSIVAALT